MNCFVFGLAGLAIHHMVPAGCDGPRSGATSNLLGSLQWILSCLWVWVALAMVTIIKPRLLLLPPQTKEFSYVTPTDKGNWLHLCTPGTKLRDVLLPQCLQKVPGNNWQVQED